MTREEFLYQLEGLATFPIEQQESLYEQMNRLWKVTVYVQELDRRHEEQIQKRAKEYEIEFNNHVWNSIALKGRWVEAKIREQEEVKEKEAKLGLSSFLNFIKESIWRS